MSAEIARLKRALDAATRRADTAEEFLGKTQESLDDAADALSRLLELEGLADPGASQRLRSRTSRRDRRLDAALKRAAMGGVGAICWEELSDGHCVVRVDGDSGVLLSARLASLLRVLAADEPGACGSDLLVRWKSIGETHNRSAICSNPRRASMRCATCFRGCARNSSRRG